MWCRWLGIAVADNIVASESFHIFLHVRISTRAAVVLCLSCPCLVRVCDSNGQQLFMEHPCIDASSLSRTLRALPSVSRAVSPLPCSKPAGSRVRSTNGTRTLHEKLLSIAITHTHKTRGQDKQERQQLEWRCVHATNLKDNRRNNVIGYSNSKSPAPHTHITHNERDAQTVSNTHTHRHVANRCECFLIRRGSLSAA